MGLFGKRRAEQEREEQLAAIRAREIADFEREQNDIAAKNEAADLAFEQREAQILAEREAFQRTPEYLEHERAERERSDDIHDRSMLKAFMAQRQERGAGRPAFTGS